MSEVDGFGSGAEVLTQPADEFRLQREARLHEEAVGDRQGRCARVPLGGFGLRGEDTLLEVADRVEPGRAFQVERGGDLLRGLALGPGPRHRQRGRDTVGRDDDVAGRQLPKQIETEGRRGVSRREGRAGRITGMSGVRATRRVREARARARVRAAAEDADRDRREAGAD